MLSRYRLQNRNLWIAILILGITASIFAGLLRSCLVFVIEFKYGIFIELFLIKLFGAVLEFKIFQNSPEGVNILFNFFYLIIITMIYIHL